MNHFRPQKTVSTTDLQQNAEAYIQDPSGPAVAIADGKGVIAYLVPAATYVDLLQELQHQGYELSALTNIK